MDWLKRSRHAGWLFLGSSREQENSGGRFVWHDVATFRLCRIPCHDGLRIGDWRTNQFSSTLRSTEFDQFRALSPVALVTGLAAILWYHVGPLLSVCSASQCVLCTRAKLGWRHDKCCRDKFHGGSKGAQYLEPGLLRQPSGGHCIAGVALSPTQWSQGGSKRERALHASRWDFKAAETCMSCGSARRHSLEVSPNVFSRFSRAEHHRLAWFMQLSVGINKS